MELDLLKKFQSAKAPGDLADKYNSFLETEEIHNLEELAENDIAIHQNGIQVKPVRLPNGLYKFKDGTGVDRVVLDCITSLQNGADLLWIETEKPNVEQIASMVNKIREVEPKAKLVYNNSPHLIGHLLSENKFIKNGQSLEKMFRHILIQIKNRED